MAGPARDVTELLLAWNSGDRRAIEELTPLVYQELRRLARSHLRREHAAHTLQGTALVHEAYLRLVDQRSVSWQGRAHFFGAAAQAMRRILVDHARHRDREKRGGGAAKLSIDQALGVPNETDVDLLALDDALNDLAALEPRQSRIIELRFFGGLSVEECAEALGISPATVKREWAFARAWLFRQIVGSREP